MEKSAVRVVVAGDNGTGKSSLIATAVSGTFPTDVPPVLPPSRLPDDIYPDHVPIIIIDTSSAVEQRNEVVEELMKADVVVLTYACDISETRDRLSTYWLPELRHLEVRVPIIVVGCKMDLRAEDPFWLERYLSPIMHQFPEVETCIECSAYSLIQIPEVFYYAQKAVIHPTAPLFDQEAQILKPRCLNALKRIFKLCDHDGDGALSDAELNEFQVKCFNTPLTPDEIEGIKSVVIARLGAEVDEHGLTLRGFLFLYCLFIENGKMETAWKIIRKFGYDGNVRLEGEFLPRSFKRAPDQSVELSNDAIGFLKGIFVTYDKDNDGAIQPADVKELFCTAPDCPWSEGPYQGAVSTTESGGLTMDGFLSQWALMTLLEPAKSVEYLKYILYSGDASSAIRLTRKRRTDRKKRQSKRNVHQCFVFGPKKAGKSSLLDAFQGRPYHDDYRESTEERYAVNAVDGPTGSKKFLVLREIPEDKVKTLLSDKESLAACYIAIFVYDSCDELSWKKTAELLHQITGHGEDTGYEVPSLIVAAKDDLGPHPVAISDSTRVSQDMGIEAPVPISAKLGEFNNIFSTIVSAAENPHLSIPETEAGRIRKHQRFVNQSLMFVSVGAALAVVGLAAYRVYVTRNNSS